MCLDLIDIDEVLTLPTQAECDDMFEIKDNSTFIQVKANKRNRIVQ